jgi:uncharacterized membrane protein YbaN (DUF454 family)
MNLWTLLGGLSLLLGGIGIFLPLLPTTPFVLLAAACFARSSPRLHQWLLQHRLFGSMLQEWEQKHCIPCRIRNLALFMMLGMGGISIAFLIQGLWLKVGGVVLILIGCFVLMRVKVCEEPAR